MSNKTTTIIIVTIICIAFLTLLGVRFLSGEDNWICVDGQWVKHGFPAGNKPNRECRNETINDTNIDNRRMEESQNQNKEATNNVDEVNIIVESPKADDIIGLPVIIKGQARVFENTVSYKIKDSDGSVLLENYLTANSKDVGEFGPFEMTVNYPEPKGDKGTVEVFEYSAKDGSEINKVEIPIVFKKVESMSIKVFFGNRKEDPDAQNCSQVYSVDRRISKTKAVAEGAIKELLNGITSQEQDEGYFSEINGNAKINKIAIKGGIAKVDFSGELFDGISGSCEIETIKNQITNTLKQFSTIEDVQITVDGQNDSL
jgi:hypothetical protein